MPNTVTQRTLLGGGSSRYIVREIHIVSDGSEESNLVVYDNSAFINDAARGSLWEIKFSGSDCLCKLSWDQSTDSPIISFNPLNAAEMCFAKSGGIKNPNGTGATGDILLSTANLDSGDEVFIYIKVRQ